MHESHCYCRVPQDMVDARFKDLMSRLDLDDLWLTFKLLLPVEDE